jgi:hypothetical protein
VYLVLGARGPLIPLSWRCGPHRTSGAGEQGSRPAAGPSVLEF